MSEKIKEVNDDSFENEVLKSEIPVLVEFGSSWCGPCKRQLPIVEKYAADKKDQVKVVKVDIDDSPKITAKLGVRSVPTLMLFQNGKQLGFKVGLSSLSEINDFVNGKLST